MGNPQSQSGVPHRIAKPGEVFVEALIWPRIRGRASRWGNFFFLSGIPDRAYCSRRTSIPSTACTKLQETKMDEGRKRV